MGVIIKQSIKNALISYAGIALGFVSTILLFPYFLTTEQYGLTRLLMSLALVCAQFAPLGINNIIIRFFPYFSESRESRGRFLSLSLLVPAVGFVLFVLLFLGTQSLFLNAFRDRSTLFSEFYLLLIPLVFGILFFEVLNNYLRALRDAVTGSLVHEVYVRAAIIIWLVVFHYDLISFPFFMMGFIGIYGLQPAYLLLKLYQRNEARLVRPKLTKKSRLSQIMGVYGGYSLLGGLATLLVGNIDIIMLGAILDLKTTAVYAIAFYVGSVIAVPQQAILKIANPVLAGLMKQKNYEAIRELYQRTSLNQIIAGSLLYIGIWANMRNLMHLLPPQYQGAQWIILIIGFSKLFGMATGINGGIILNSTYYRVDLYTNVLLVVIAIATNFWLIPTYGMMGAAIATTVSIVIYNIIKLIFVQVTFSMQPFRWNAPVILGIAAGCLILSFQIPYLHNFIIDVTVRSGAIAIGFLGTILMFNLSDDVQKLSRETIRRVKAIVQ